MFTAAKEYPTKPREMMIHKTMIVINDNIVVSPSALNHHLQLNVEIILLSEVESLFRFIIYAVNILKFMIFNSLSTFVQLHIFFLLIYIQSSKLYLI